MTWQIILVLSLTGLAMFFFAFEWVSPDVTALGLLLALTISGLLPVEKAFAGFGSDAVIVILGLFILAAALLRTGVVDFAEQRLFRYTGENPFRLLATIMMTTAVSDGISQLRYDHPHGDDRHLAPRPSMALRAEDIVLIEGNRDEILKIKDTPGIDIKGDIRLVDPETDAEEIGLAEVIIPPCSLLARRTLTQIGFRQRYGLQVPGINRHGDVLRSKLGDVNLSVGDVLLVQGEHANLARLELDSAFQILETKGSAKRRGLENILAEGAD
jgi:di/tricarboxylate transporter